MATRPEPAPSDELTPRIGRVATRALADLGCATYADLTRHSSKELLAIHGVGPKAIGILDDELQARGLTFRGD